MNKFTLKLLPTLFVVSLFSIIGCGVKFNSEDITREKNQSTVLAETQSKSLKNIVDSLKINKNSISIKVLKSKYKMEIYFGTTLLKTFPVVFGFNAIDDKLKQGDGCTPEGVFGIRAKYPHSSWSKFIWIDYPNKQSWQKHAEAKKDGIISKKSAIGGEVGIHGVPEGYDYIIDERQNWTLGCISLKNKDVDDLYESIGAKTLITIVK